MFSVVFQMMMIMMITLCCLLILSIWVSSRISTTIMKPLAVLKNKMKLVSQGKLDVSFDSQDTQYGEVGMISNTVDNMLGEIRQLIA
jgi:two-component system sensor histidine kinase YesM